jgi:YVTN family beta-propeller protein
VIDEARFPGRQGRLLFAYLVAEQGRPVPRGELAEALWGEAPPPTWDKALTVIVSKVRSLLPDRDDGANALTSAFGCYRLDLPEGTWVDVIVAVAAAQEAEEALTTGDLEKAKTAAALAASLLRQPFLPGEDGTWVAEKRREFADVRSRALSALADACLRSGDAPAAAKWAEQTIALAPFRETGYRRLMEAHVAAGNRAEALQVYEQCRLLLAEELGAYPSPETESIYRGLLEAPPVAAPAAAAIELPSPTNGGDVGQAATQAGRRRVLLVLVCGTVAAAGAVTATVELVTRGSPRSATLEVSANSVGAFDARNGKRIAQVSVPTGPSALAAGMGAVWVANVDDNSVSKIDPQTNSSVDTIPVGNAPSGIAVGGGHVWVTNSLGGTVSRIDPKTDTPVQVIRVGNGPLGVAYGAGAVWVANSTDRTVTEIDSATGKPEDPIPVAAGADGIAVGDGAVWVTSESDGSLSRIDPRARIVTQPINVGRGAGAVAVGPRAVWVANRVDGTVTRVDPATNAVSATITVGAGPTGIAVSPDGKAVWVSSEIAGTLSQIDPVQKRVVRTVTTGNRPEDVAMTGNTLYAAVRTSGLAHRGGALTILTAGTFDSIDPAVAYEPSYLAWNAIILTNDGLVTFKRVGGSDGTRLVPDLATTIPTPTDGGRTYTFQVRRGIHYSNGALVQPADFRRAIERSVASYASAGLGGGLYFSSIAGYGQCLKTPRRCDLSKGIVTDPASNMVTFHLTAPDPDFLERLALPASDAVPASTPLKARLPLPATGPYMIASYDAKRGVRLVRNPRFHEWYQAAQPDGYPDDIVWRFNVLPSAQRRAVEQGKADLANDAGSADKGTYPPPVLLTGLQTRYASQLHLDQLIRTYYVFLNTRVPPFNNLKARQAVNYAVDRNQMATLRGGPDLERPSCQVLPPNINGYQRYCPYTTEQSADGSYTGPDLAKARQLVAESGTRGQRVTVAGAAGIFQPHGGEYFVSVLRSLGYRARFRNIKGVHTYFVMAGDSRQRIQAGIGGWSQDYPTAGNFLPPLLTCSSFIPRSRANMNLAEFCNRSIDAEIARARSLEVADPGAASRLWRQVDHDVVQQAPWVFLQNPLQVSLVSRRVGNYQYNPQWGVLLDQLWVR